MSGGSIIVNFGAPEESLLQVENGEVVSIGRTPDPEAQRMLLLSFPEVSERHAKIHCRANGWKIVDLGSTNGTTISGLRLTPGREFSLENNEVITIAGYELKVMMKMAPVIQPNLRLDERHYRINGDESD